MKASPFPYEPGQSGWITPNDERGAYTPLRCTVVGIEGEQLLITSPSFSEPTKIDEKRFFFALAHAQRATYLQSVASNPALFTDRKKYKAELVQLLTEDRGDARVDLDYAWSRAAYQ